MEWSKWILPGQGRGPCSWLQAFLGTWLWSKLFWMLWGWWGLCTQDSCFFPQCDVFTGSSLSARPPFLVPLASPSCNKCFQVGYERSHTSHNWKGMVRKWVCILSTHHPNASGDSEAWRWKVAQQTLPLWARHRRLLMVWKHIKGRLFWKLDSKGYKWISDHKYCIRWWPIHSNQRTLADIEVLTC